MTSATTESASGTRGYRGEGHGLILFASVLLVIVGCFNLIYGIAAIAHSHVFVANAQYVFGNLRAWGWITLIIGVLQLLAAAGVGGREPAGPLVRGGGARAERDRPDVLHPRLPVLVTGDHHGGRGRAVRAVRLRQPREPHRLMRPACASAAGRTVQLRVDTAGSPAGWSSSTLRCAGGQ
jgi:hypothetical protein